MLCVSSGMKGLQGDPQFHEVFAVEVGERLQVRACYFITCF